MLVDILPKEYVYRILKSAIISDQQFYCHLRCNVSSEEEFNKWLREFEYVTDTTWIPERSTKRLPNIHFLFWRKYICSGGIRTDPPVSPYSISYKKQAAKESKICPASLFVHIKRNNKFTHYSDPLLKDGCCAFIKINFQHNHNVLIADTLNQPARSEEPQRFFAQEDDSDVISSSPEEYNELVTPHLHNITESSSNSIAFCENLLENKRPKQESVNRNKHNKVIGQFLGHMAKIAALVEESNDDELLKHMEVFTERAANIQTITDLCDFLHPHEDCKKKVC